MRFNTDPSFVGIACLKAKHASQIDQFETWAAQSFWEAFHVSHYDWWAFPISHRSSYGLAWSVYEGEAVELKSDPIFVNRYLRGIELVAASWGWDVARTSYLPDPQPGQSWHQWPVRLFKAALSAKEFGYQEHFVSLRAYARILMEQGEPFSFNGHDLGWLFNSD